jgi:hypothetical protein
MRGADVFRMIARDCIFDRTNKKPGAQAGAFAC